MTEYMVDAYAWVEYLEGSKQGEKVQQIIKNHVCFTSAVTLAEVVSKAKRTGKDSQMAFDAVALNSRVLNVNEGTAKIAGLFHAEMRKKSKNFGLADAFILAQRTKKQKIVTGDPHFLGIENIEFLK